MAAHFFQCEMFPQINKLQSYPGSIVGGGSLATSRSFSSCNSFSAWCQNSFVLQRAVGGLRVGLVLLRGDLNQITAAGRRSRLDGIGGGETSRRRRIGCWRALWRQRQRCVGAGIGGRWVTLGRSSWRGRRSGSGGRFCRGGRTPPAPTVLGGIGLPR